MRLLAKYPHNVETPSLLLLLFHIPFIFCRMPPLQHQRKHLRDELAQPPPALTRSTITCHHKARVQPQPKPTPLSPQRGTARQETTLEDLATTSEEAIRERSEWLALDKAEWREREGERWRGEWRASREQEEEEKGGQSRETERQEQREHDTRRVHTPTTTRS